MNTGLMAILLVIFNLFDMVMTRSMVGMELAQEANPAMAYLLPRWHWFEVAKVASCVGPWLLWKSDIAFSRISLVTLTVIYAALTVYHIALWSMMG